MAQRKIDSIVQKLERRQQSVTTTPTTPTTSPPSTNNQSLLPAESVTSQRKIPSPSQAVASSGRVATPETRPDVGGIFDNRVVENGRES